MPDDLEQLVRDAVEQTGAAPPRLLDADAPTLLLGDDKSSSAANDFYFVGLIGGKEVGKSAMVNALAGATITAVTSHGAGTAGVVAHVHASRASAVKALLDREAAGKYRLVTHELSGDPARVLLDLPDIDSHFESHLALTRRMLRHMLFPVWLVSIEKYADGQPRQMLARVAEGNDPRNFVFVLNKADQLRDEPDAADEIRDDYARRVAAAVGLDAPPRVWVVSAQQPTAYDLPDLRAALSRNRTTTDLAQARGIAARRRSHSLTSWLTTLDLPARAARAERARVEAEELLTARVVGPLLERSIPRLSAEPSYRAALGEEAMNVRVARWPLVNLVHTLLGPLLAGLTTVVRGGTARAAGDAAGLVDAHLSIDGGPAHRPLQGAFAHLHGTSPLLAGAYVARQPWKDLDAELAIGELRQAWTDVLDRQRAEVVDRLGRSRNPFAAIGRWTLTIGALLWFPFIQPALNAALQPGFVRTNQQLALLLVDLLGTTYLLRTAAFLVVYYLVLWAMLRRGTQRRVSKMLASWARDGREDLDLSRATLRWADELLAPVNRAAVSAGQLAERAVAAGSATATVTATVTAAT